MVSSDDSGDHCSEAEEQEDEVAIPRQWLEDPGPEDLNQDLVPASPAPSSNPETDAAARPNHVGNVGGASSDARGAGIDAPTFTQRCSTDGHRTVCQILLPVLLQVMQEPDWSGRVPREQVRQACQRCSAKRDELSF